VAWVRLSAVLTLNVERKEPGLLVLVDAPLVQARHGVIGVVGEEVPGGTAVNLRGG